SHGARVDRLLRSPDVPCHQVGHEPRCRARRRAAREYVARSCRRSAYCGDRPMDRSTPPPAPTAAAAAAVARAFHLERFRDYLALEAGNSHHTVENYLRDITRLGVYATSKGVKVPEQLSAPQLRDFIYFLKDLGLAPTTIRRQISAIRTYFKFLVGEGIAARDPSERIESPKRWRTLPAVLTVAEVGKLLDAPNTNALLPQRDVALLEFAYATGVRVSELVSLKLQDISFGERVVRVFGKGGKERIVPFGKTALGRIASYVREVRPRLDRGKGRGVLFLNARGTPLSRVGAWGIIKVNARRAGLSKRVTPHTLRHRSEEHTSELQSRSDLVCRLLLD